MNIINKIRNAFTGGEWFVAYSNANESDWEIAKAPDKEWCADPFVIENGSNKYIFVEQYSKDKDKGSIGYFEFVDGKPVSQGIIIENTYHMSYPDVFKYGDRYYMIPESSANNSVDLYVAEHFPDIWKKEKSLITGKKYVDSTVYQDNSGLYLISYTMIGGYEIHVFMLNMKSKEVELISKKRYEKNVARPGGRLFIENGKLLRPAQDCSRKYGEALILYQVDALNRDGYFEEHELKRIEICSIKTPLESDRIHHLTIDSTYRAIDLYQERFDPLHFLKILIRSHRK